MTTSTDTSRRHEIERQVSGLFAKSRSFQSLPPEEQTAIRTGTAAILETMAGRPDPYAMGLGGLTPPPLGSSTTGGAATTPFTGGATQKEAFGPKKQGDFGTGVATAVGQAGELLRQVNFPAFVSELIQGVFQSVVDASIRQMKAYGELVQSITMSLNDFRDQNVTPNQGRDHLVQKYPSLMQISIQNGEPRVIPKDGADASSMPNFREELGLDTDITSLDPEVIEEKLVPAARNDLARSRQGLLSTMVLMGINRIVVTDGKINAKLQFSFSARDSMQTHAQNFDYKNFGTTTASQGTYEANADDSGGNYSRDKDGSVSREYGSSSRYAKGEWQSTTTPAIYVTSQSDTTTQAEMQASGRLSGEVSLNFKSETFDLNKLASADEVFRMERVRSAGRGAPAPGPQGAAGTPPSQTSQGSPPQGSTSTNPTTTAPARS